MKTSLVLVVSCLFIGVYSAPPISNEVIDIIFRDGKYPYHVAIVKKGSKEILCDGVIVNEKWVVTMKKGLLGTDLLVSNMQLVVGGVVNLAFDVAKKLTYSVSSYKTPPNLPIVFLKVEEGKNLLTPVYSIHPQAAVFKKFEEDLPALTERFKGKTLRATSYQYDAIGRTPYRDKLLHSSIAKFEEGEMNTSLHEFSIHVHANVLCMSSLGAPLVEANDETVTVVGIGLGCNYSYVTEKRYWIPSVNVYEFLNDESTSGKK
jgi:hypothetical protein